MSRDPLDFLRDIEESSIRIGDYAAGLSKDEVFTDKMRFDGILHNFHVIGEAVKKLPDDLRRENSDIPWAEIAGMRDLIAHAEAYKPKNQTSAGTMLQSSSLPPAPKFKTEK